MPNQPQEWTVGDTIYLVLALTYAAFNVVLLLRYARGELGPVPFQLLELFFALSVFGLLAAYPIQRLLRSVGVTWRSGVAVTLVFLVLAGFNVRCLASAAAAV